MNLHIGFSNNLTYVGPTTYYGLNYGMTGQWISAFHRSCVFRPHGSQTEHIVPLKYLYSHQITPTRHCPKPE